MANGFRPEGWGEIVRSADYKNERDFELGADAMLKALREHHTTLLTELSPYPVVFKGTTLVLIPDDKE